MTGNANPNIQGEGVTLARVAAVTQWPPGEEGSSSVYSEIANLSKQSLPGSHRPYWATANPALFRENARYLMPAIVQYPARQ